MDYSVEKNMSIIMYLNVIVNPYWLYESKVFTHPWRVVKSNLAERVGTYSSELCFTLIYVSLFAHNLQVNMVQ